MNKYFKWKVLLIIASIAGSLWLIYPPETWNHFPATDKVNLGLDLQGGMHLLLRVDLNAIPETAREDAADRALEVIRNRIDAFGVREPSITKQGKDQIVVQLPGVTDQKRAKDIIGKTALLEFRLVEHDPEVIKKAEEAGGQAPEGFEWLDLKDERISEKLLAKKTAELTGEHLVSADVQLGDFSQPVVSLEFDSEGGKIFSDVTSRAAADFRRDGMTRRLAIILDGELRTAPQMKEAIYGGKAVIEGSFSYEEASDTALMLRAGALPAPIIIEEERTVGPTLGSDSVRQGIRASLVGGLLVVVFMGGYYLVSGLISTFALFLNLLLLVAGLVLFHASLTLPGIAGIILSLGMAVDANVLIFERIREEVKLGKAVRSAISSGYHNALSAIVDSNITTLITSFILFYFGTGPIRGFAVTLTIGLAASMFTSIIVTRVIFDFLTRGDRKVSLRMLQAFGVTHFDFIRLRKKTYIFSGVLLLIGLVLFIRRGDANYGIDFTGGAVMQIKFKQDVPLADIRVRLEKENLADVQIQNFGEPGQHEVIIKTAADEASRVEPVLASLAGEGQYEILRYETVGPAAGSQLREKAVKAFIWALVLMLIYLSVRFKPVYAVAAIVALFHDVLVTAFVFSIAGREFSLSIIAVLLTIVGYSVNDTIVIFDRIREGVKLMRRTPFPDVVNTCVNQTLSRTFLTSLTVLLTVLALFFFGGEVINDFAFTMLVGVIAGTYSTVFIASPIVVDWLASKSKSKVTRRA